MIVLLFCLILIGVCLVIATFYTVEGVVGRILDDADSSILFIIVLAISLAITLALQQPFMELTAHLSLHDFQRECAKAADYGYECKPIADPS